jgi:type I restriction-modification system DNA methylase subunit
MALKKSELYSSLWSSCDELRGGMDASQYKDYVLVLLFIKYVSDKYAGQPYAPITIPKGASFKDMVALKGKPDIGDQINKKIIAPLANAKTVRFPRLQRRHQAWHRQGDGGPAHQPRCHLREPCARLLEESR